VKVLSDYQRLRVENAASRVGLTSFAYLWRKDQKTLLREIIESGIVAILVKVGAVGLDPRKHLGKTLQEMEPHLLHLEDKYGVSVCGEGGEYETFVLDCPMFKKRIVVDESDVVELSDNPYNPCGYLKIGAYHLEEKDTHYAGGNSVKTLKPFPPLEEDVDATEDLKCSKPGKEFSGPDRNSTDIWSSSVVTDRFAHFYARSKLEGEDGIDAVLQELAANLETNSIAWTDAYYINLYIADMSQFGAINAHYSKFLPGSAPSSRACIEVGSGTQMDVACTKMDRKSLHVQSLSEWAPPCIGPYAQANTVNRLVHLAGIIPLFPPTSTITDGLGPRAQMRACLQHLAAILSVVGGEEDSVVLAVVYVSNKKCFPGVVAELRQQLRDIRRTCIVPVSALPKNAKTEISCAISQEPLKPSDTYDGDTVCGTTRITWSSAVASGIFSMQAAVINNQLEPDDLFVFLSDHIRGKAMSIRIFLSPDSPIGASTAEQLLRDICPVVIVVPATDLMRAAACEDPALLTVQVICDLQTSTSKL